MLTATNNRVQAAINRVRPKLAALEEAKRTALETTLALDFEEHFAYQTQQAQAHAMGRLSLDEAQIVYVALGEVGSSDNGGWAAGTDLATKVVVTQLVGELMAAASR